MITLYSWNVNGIRAAESKGFLDWLAEAQPDILGVQEIKAQPDQLTQKLREPEGFHTRWASAERKGYSGVALYSKLEPLSVQIGIGIEEFDSEGRTLAAEYDGFVFVTTYIPSGRRDHSRVDYKLQYGDALLQYCAGLRDQGKSVIIVGDINIAHQEIDLARPKTNKKTSGFLDVERAWVDKVIDEAGYIDVFRQLYPEREEAYSWWSLRSGARGRNVGWRLDYFLITPDLLGRVVDAEIHPDIMGSDHCPVSLTLKD